MLRIAPQEEGTQFASMERVKRDEMIRKMK